MKAHKIELQELSRFPKSWVADDGTTMPRKWIEDLSIAEQEVLGWYEVTDNVPAYDSAIEKISSTGLTFTGNSIVKGYSVTVIPQVELDLISAQAKKVDRTLSVSQIIVTTSTGKTFDGDEISQSRMARAVIFSQPLDTTLWVLADNSLAIVTREELMEAGLLSGQAQTVIWSQ